MKEKKQEAALALINPTEEIMLPDGLLTMDDVNPNQEEETPIFPYVSIRNKDPKTDINTKWSKGWWKIRNAVTPTDDMEILRGVVLFWSKGRVYFLEGDEEPRCKSINGIKGSLLNDDTDNGNCLTCKYSQWTDKRPACSEGRILYCFLEGIGGCVVKFGVSGINVWRAFDNLMKSKTVDAPNGEKIRIPWHYNIIEMRTEKIVKPAYDPYWIPVVTHVEVIKDATTIKMLRELIRNKEQYDTTAQTTDLGSEDVVGKPKEHYDDGSPIVGKDEEKLPWD